MEKKSENKTWLKTKKKNRQKVIIFEATSFFKKKNETFSCLPLLWETKAFKSWWFTGKFFLYVPICHPMRENPKSSAPFNSVHNVLKKQTCILKNLEKKKQKTKRTSSNEKLTNFFHQGTVLLREEQLRGVLLSHSLFKLRKSHRKRSAKI